MCEKFYDFSNTHHCVIYKPCDDPIVTRCPIKHIAESVPCIRYLCPNEKPTGHLLVSLDALSSSNDSSESYVGSEGSNLGRDIGSEGSNLGRDIGYGIAGLVAFIIIVLMAILLFKKRIKTFVFRLRRSLFGVLMCATFSYRQQPQEFRMEMTAGNTALSTIVEMTDPSAPPEEAPPTYSSLMTPNNRLSIEQGINVDDLTNRLNNLSLIENHSDLNENQSELSEISDLNYESGLDQDQNSNEIETESVCLIDLKDNDEVPEQVEDNLNLENENDSVLINLDLNEPDQESLDLYPDLSQMKE